MRAFDPVLPAGLLPPEESLTVLDDSVLPANLDWERFTDALPTWMSGHIGCVLAGRLGDLTAVSTGCRSPNLYIGPSIQRQPARR